jgi:hypothetical protein
MCYGDDNETVLYLSNNNPFNWTMWTPFPSGKELHQWQLAISSNFSVTFRY